MNVKQLVKNSPEYWELVAIYGSEKAVDDLLASKTQRSQEIIKAGVAYKSQRPTPTLADLQQQQKRLNTQIKALSTAFKNDAEATLARGLVELLSYTRGMGLLDDDVLNLVAQTSLAEVLSVVLSLNGTKATKGYYYVSSFYGAVMKSVDLADVQQLVAQKHTETHPQNSFDPFFS